MFANRRRRQAGFTLPEIIAAVAIIGLLAALALNEMGGAVARAKRTEALEGLEALNSAQQSYFASHGQYAGSFDALDWAIEGGERRSPTTYVGNRYTYELSQPFGSETWYCVAQANLDPDPFPDIVEAYDL